MQLGLFLDLGTHPIKPLYLVKQIDKKVFTL